MLDLNNAEMFGQYVVREIKDIIGEKLKAANAEIEELKTQVRDLQYDLHTVMQMAGKQGEPGPAHGHPRDQRAFRAGEAILRGVSLA